MLNITLRSETKVVFPLYSGKRVIISTTIICVRIKFGFIFLSSLIEENYRKALMGCKVDPLHGLFRFPDSLYCS